MKSKKKLKVLVVDDEPNILMPLEFMMRKNGFQVFVARNSTEAIESVNVQFPDVVVLDITRPNINGFEVCQHIRKKSEMISAKIIFLGSGRMEVDAKKGSGVKPDLYVSKPFSTRSLVEKIKKLTQTSDP